MAETKKYYWLKLKEDFFTDKEIKKLRKIAGGDTYTIIYLKLMLLGLRDEGKLFFEGIEDNFAEELALELDEDAENVKVTLLYLNRMGLIQEVTENELFLTRLPECVGKETSKAELMRKKRARDKLLIESGNNVTDVLPDVTKSYTEIEKEEREKKKELEREKEKEKEKENRKKIYEEIVSYLNEKANTRFRPTGKETQRHINARLNEGFTVEDFKTVIDKKVLQWLNDNEMAQYLRPETLFGTKFESYLNAPVSTPKTNGGERIEIIDGKEYLFKNGHYYIPGGSNIAVNPFATDDLPF